MTAKDNIKFLKNNISSFDSASAEALKHWEKQLKKHDLYKRWSEHPVTREVMAFIFKEMIALDSALSTDPDMTELERKSIFKVKPIYRYLLTLARATDKSVELLDQEIAEAMQRAKDYSSFPGK